MIRKPLLERPKAIELFRGDDSDAFNLRTVKIKLSGDIDLTGATARFTLPEYTKTFTSTEVESETLTLVFTSDDTKKFPLGMCFGTLELFDSNNKRLTIANRIPFYVSHDVIGMPDQEYGITVRLSVNTEINIDFVVSGSGSGETLWKTQNSGREITPSSSSVQLLKVKKINLTALSNLLPITSPYNLTTVKDAVNALINALKGTVEE